MIGLTTSSMICNCFMPILQTLKQHLLRMITAKQYCNTLLQWNSPTHRISLFQFLRHLSEGVSKLIADSNMNPKMANCSIGLTFIRIREELTEKKGFQSIGYQDFKLDRNILSRVCQRIFQIEKIYNRSHQDGNQQLFSTKLGNNSIELGSKKTMTITRKAATKSSSPSIILFFLCKKFFLNPMNHSYFIIHLMSFYFQFSIQYLKIICDNCDKKEVDIIKNILIFV